MRARNTCWYIHTGIPYKHTWGKRAQSSTSPTNTERNSERKHYVGKENLCKFKGFPRLARPTEEIRSAEEVGGERERASSDAVFVRNLRKERQQKT